MADSRGLCCLVCYNVFKSDEVEFIPRNLNCGHTYCSGCLGKLATQYNGMSIRCPTCKAETSLCGRLSGISSLPKNFGVLEILETTGSEATTNLPLGGIESEKDRNKWLCPEHDEALKVFCFTDNCLICIYCQVYGSHAGHKCELASNIARDAREELRRASKKLGEIYDTVSKARKKVVETKENLVDTQEYLKKKIKKHHGILRTCLSRRECALKSIVDDKTKQRLDPIQTQESMMTEILEKTDKAYSLIKKCENNDSAMVEDKQSIDKLIVEVSDLYQKCEMGPEAQDNLAYRFEYDTCCTLETKVGKIIEVNTEGLEEQSRENPTLQGKPPEPEVRHMPGERVGQQQLRSADNSRRHRPNPNSSDDEVERGEVRFALSRPDDVVDDSDDTERTEHLQEIQQEIDRLRLLGPEDVIGGEFKRVQVDFETRFSKTFKGPQLTHTARPGMAELREVRRPGMPLVEPEEVAAANHQPPTDGMGTQCYMADCRHRALLLCSYCTHIFCVNCALPTCSLPCNGSSQEQHNFTYIQSSSKPGHSERQDGDCGTSSSHRSLYKEEEWQCGLCTMVNQPRVLACVACKKTRGFDSRQGCKVCPMCTLVNKPGTVKCELCETDLVPPQDSKCVTDDCTSSDN